MTTQEHDRAANNRATAIVQGLVGAYLILVGGFAGWHGEALWTWENALLMGLPPVAAALLVGLRDFLRNPSPFLVLPLLGLYLLMGVVMGGMGLGIAWVTVEAVGDWGDPYTRSATAAVALLVLSVVIWVAYRPGKRAVEEGGE
jgi:hypothetical protein